MALRGVKPEKIEKRLKAFFYGAAGVGKTTAAISFPKVYLIDTERGAENAQYSELISKGGGVVFQTSDFDEMVKEIRALLSEKHDFKTLVIDPLTIVYNDLLDQSALKVGTEFGRHYGEANKKMKTLLNLLLRLDMNVIITSHAKNEYSEGMKVIGQTFDCYKKLDYLFDLVFEVVKRGNEIKALVRKSRVEGFKESELFPFCYDEIAKRYGREIIERDAVAQELASEEDVERAKKLIGLLKTPEETVHKWLEKAQSSALEEMPKGAITKCIDYMQKQIGETQ